MDNNQFGYGMGKLLAGLAPRGYYFSHTDDKTAKLAYAHYSDPNFEYPGAVIFGQMRDGLTRFNASIIPYNVREESYNSATEATGIKHQCVLNTEYVISTYLGFKVDVICVVAYADDCGYPVYDFYYE